MLKSIGRDNLLVMLALLIWALGEGLWINVRQLYFASLGASPVDVGTALALEGIGKALMLLPAGYGIDRIGARPMLIASWLLGIGGAVILAAAGTWQVAAGGMMLYGMSGFAIPSVSAYALLAAPRSDPPRSAQRILAPMFAVYPLGLIVSPTLGGILAAQAGSIRACLFVAIGLFMISTLALLATRPMPLHTSHREYRVDALLHNRGYLLRAGYFGVGMFALWIGFALIPNFMQDIRGIELATLGLLYSIFSIGTTMINLAVGRLPQRWGYPVVLAAVWLGIMGIWQIGELAGIAPSFFFLGAVYTARPLAVAGLERAVDPQDRGMAFSGLEMLTALMVAAASQLAGGLYKVSPTHDLPLIGALFALPVLATVWFAARMWHSEIPPPVLTVQPAAGDQPVPDNS